MHHCPLVEMWLASLASTRGGKSRSHDGLVHVDDVCGVGDAESTTGCPHMRNLALTHERMQHPSKRLASTRGDVPLRLTRRPLKHFMH